HCRARAGKTLTLSLPARRSQVAEDVRGDLVGVVAREHVVDARDHDQLGAWQDLREALTDRERADPVGVAPDEQRRRGPRREPGGESVPRATDAWRAVGGGGDAPGCPPAAGPRA